MGSLQAKPSQVACLDVEDVVFMMAIKRLGTCYRHRGGAVGQFYARSHTVSLSQVVISRAVHTCIRSRTSLVVYG